MKIWVLTSTYNMYDQHGAYYLAWFITKPSVEDIIKILFTDGYSNAHETYVKELANLLLTKGETPDGGGGTTQYHLEEEFPSN